MRLNDDGKVVPAMDLLVPWVIRSSMFPYNHMTSFTSHEYASMAKWVGELIGGSQREERLDYLDNCLDELKLSKESL
ncbi:hypothetical protein Tco_1004758 [Tanacetum coccineum]|uniref:Uncharacterized protein n=1 Tax=Tanacetum coccineum TaxID=301880 RepID=A0ABQ5FCY8_9ASTR